MIIENNFMIDNLNSLSTSDIVAIFNEAFSDYQVPLRLNETDMQRKFISENIVLENSAGVFCNQKCIGFILIGIDVFGDAKLAYNAGTGIIPEFRGKGLTQKMYQYLFPFLFKKGISNYLLEVLIENKFAIEVYKEIGYVIQREFICYRGFVLRKENKSKTSIKEISINELKISSDFANQMPAYQNNFSSILRTTEAYIFFGAYVEKKLVGFLILDKINFRIKQFGVHKNYRRKYIGTALFFRAQQFANKNPLSIINVDFNNKDTIHFLAATGLKEYVKQYEMSYQYED